MFLTHGIYALRYGVLHIVVIWRPTRVKEFRSVCEVPRNVADSMSIFVHILDEDIRSFIGDEVSSYFDESVKMEFVLLDI